MILKMNVVIFHENNEGFGGMETLLLRFYDYFCAHGFEVFYISKHDTYSARGYSRPNMVFLGEAYKQLISRRFLIRQLKELGVADIRLAIAMDSFSALIAPLLSTIQRHKQCVALATNWVPNYFRMQNTKRYHPMSLAQSYNLKKHYNRDSILFMTSQYISEGRMILGPDWNATLFPVPINAARYSSVKRSPDRKKIVSVGRLASMKEYNLYMPEILARLVAKGYDVHWDVYGVGEYKGQVENEIKKGGLTGRINLLGELPYEKFPEVLAKAGYFLGMGTAVLEAAAAGVPNIVAVAYDATGITHGPLYAQKYGNLGEVDKTQELYQVEDELRRLLRCSEEDYQRECVRNADAARAYDETMLLAKLENKLRLKPIPPSFFFYSLLDAYATLRWMFTRVCSLASMFRK